MELIRGISGLDKDIPLGTFLITVVDILDYPFHISFLIKGEKSPYTGILDGLGGIWEKSKFSELLLGKSMNVRILYETISEYNDEIVAGIVISQDEEEEIIEKIFKMKEIQENITTLFLYPYYLKYRRNYLPMGFLPVEVLEVYPGGVIRATNGTNSNFISFQSKALEKLLSNRSYETNKFLLRLLARKEICINGAIIEKMEEKASNSLVDPFPTEIYFQNVNLTSIIFSLYDGISKEDFVDEYGEENKHIFETFSENKKFCAKKLVNYTNNYQSKLFIRDNPNFEILVTEIIDPITFKGISFQNNAMVKFRTIGTFFPEQTIFKDKKEIFTELLFKKYVSSTFTISAEDVDSKGVILGSAIKDENCIGSYLVKNGYCMVSMKGRSIYKSAYAQAKEEGKGLHNSNLTLLEEWKRELPEHCTGVISHSDNLKSMYFQRDSDISALKHIDSICQNCDKSKIQELRKGEFCLALYEGEWFRAEIRQITIDNKVEVFFFDYGNTETVLNHEVIEMPIEFYAFPRMSHKISFYNLLFPNSGHELYEFVLNEVCEEIQDAQLELQIYQNNKALFFKNKELLNSKFIRNGLCRISDETLTPIWLEDMKFARHSDKGIWTCHDSLEEEVKGHIDPLDYLDKI